MKKDIKVPRQKKGYEKMAYTEQHKSAIRSKISSIIRTCNALEKALSANDVDIIDNTIDSLGFRIEELQDNKKSWLLQYSQNCYGENTIKSIRL